MSTPTGDRIVAALGALRADADRWTRSAEEMQAAATTAAGQAVPPAAFSFAGQAVAAAHDALRSKIDALLAAGAANFTDIAGALTASAAAYEADEAAHVHRLRGIY